MRIYALLFVSLILTICLSLAPSAVKASNRVALVIGNSEYQAEPLKTPVTDAQDISTALSNIGFKVTTLTSVDRRELLKGLNTFAGKLKNAELGLFFFAGHAVQVEGDNFLLPLNAAVHSAVDIEYEAVQLSRVFDKMGEANNQHNIVILDACRANPFSSFLANPSNGLAPVEVPPGMIISYAASPGSLANEGTGKNSIFTTHLIKALKGEELIVQDWFDAAVAGVLEETKKQQKPWIKSSRSDSIYLIGERPTKEESAPQPAASPVKTEAIEESTGSTTQWGRLEVIVWPSDATIRVLNIGPKYRSGMKLPAGRYQIEASRAGYKTLRQWVEVASEEYAEYDLQLEEDYPGSGVKTPISSGKQTERSQDSNKGANRWAWLEVIPIPGDARIRVLNIVPKYKPSMQLSPGRYHIEVSKEGYQTEKKWIELAPGEHGAFNVELEKIQPTVDEQPASVRQFKEAPPTNVTDNQNVTIADSYSQLIWPIKDNGQNISWASAKTYCGSLALGQYSNWRLPTTDELKRLFQSDSGKMITTSGKSLWSSSVKRDTAVRFDIARRNTFKSLKTNSIDMRVLCTGQLTESNKKKAKVYKSETQAPQNTGQLIKDKYIAYFSSDEFIREMYRKMDDKGISPEAAKKINECLQKEVLEVIKNTPEKELENSEFKNPTLENKIISEVQNICGSGEALKYFLITEISTEKYRGEIYKKYIADGISPHIARSLSDCVIAGISDAIMNIPTDEMDLKDPFKHLKENFTEKEMSNLYYECKNNRIK